MPWRDRGPDPQSHPLNLPLIGRDSSVLGQIATARLIGLLSGGPAHETRQRRGVEPFESQGRVGWTMPRLALGVVIVISFNGDFTKESGHPRRTSSHPYLTDSGLVISIDPINSALEQLGKDRGPGTEQGGSELPFQFEQGRLLLEGGRDYSLDLGLEFGRECLL